MFKFDLPLWKSTLGVQQSCSSSPSRLHSRLGRSHHSEGRWSSVSFVSSTNPSESVSQSNCFTLIFSPFEWSLTLNAYDMTVILLCIHFLKTICTSSQLEPPSVKKNQYFLLTGLWKLIKTMIFNQKVEKSKHLKGQLGHPVTDGVRDEKAFFQAVSRTGELSSLCNEGLQCRSGPIGAECQRQEATLRTPQNVPARRILVRRSSLGPPPGGRHRT